MKINTLVRHISLTLVLFVATCVSQEIRADPVSIEPANAFTVTLVLLTPINATINCGSSAEFTVILKGTGASDNDAQALLWSVFDRDLISDDELIGETRFFVLGDGTGTGNWQETFTFTLDCTGNCTLRGVAGSSGESVAEVFVLIEFPFGSDAGESNQVDVSCVPEPTSMFLLGLGLAAVAIKTRKRF